MKTEILAISDLLRNSLLALTPHLNIRYGPGQIEGFNTQLETVLYIDRNKTPSTFVIKVNDDETITFFASHFDLKEWKYNQSIEEAINFFSAAIELDKMYKKVHFFSAAENDKNSMFCKCGKYLTDEIHYRKEKIKS
jgi:hypothetical protein